METYKKIKLSNLQKDDVFVMEEPKDGFFQKVFIVEKVEDTKRDYLNIHAVSGVEGRMMPAGKGAADVYLINAGDKHSEERFNDFEIEKLQSLLEDVYKQKLELEKAVNELTRKKVSGLYYDMIGKVISFENDVCDSCVMIVNNVTEDNVNGRCISFDPESGLASFMPDYTVSKSFLFYESEVEVRDYPYWLSTISKIFNVEVKKI